MTYFDAYIGDLEDPKFSWDGGDWNGNTPKRLGPFFPPTRTNRGYPSNVFAEIVARIDEKTLEGKQTDWGAWVAKADKTTLRAFVDDLYSGDGSYSKGSLFPHLVESLEELRAFIEGLEENKECALVASEL